ncbi:MAG: response regulator [Candidatus Tantalella remota]|nr:response regulator [Candidatus Tantalella remota]
MLNILIVDDEVEIQCLFRRILEKEGYRVRTTGSGQEAVKMIKIETYDMMFLDIRLPMFSVSDVLRNIKDISPRMRIFTMSGKPIEERLKTVLLSETNGFLSKPFRIEEVRKIVAGQAG